MPIAVLFVKGATTSLSSPPTQEMVSAINRNILVASAFSQFKDHIFIISTDFVKANKRTN